MLESMKKSNNVQKTQNRSDHGLEHDTSRVDQIMAPHNARQAFDSSPRFSETSDCPDTGEVAISKSLEDIKRRIHLEPRWNRMYFCL